MVRRTLSPATGDSVRYAAPTGAPDGSTVSWIWPSCAAQVAVVRLLDAALAGGADRGQASRRRNGPWMFSAVIAPTNPIRLGLTGPNSRSDGYCAGRCARTARRGSAPAARARRPSCAGDGERQRHRVAGVGLETRANTCHMCGYGTASTHASRFSTRHGGWVGSACWSARSGGARRLAQPRRVDLHGDRGGVRRPARCRCGRGSRPAATARRSCARCSARRPRRTGRSAAPAAPTAGRAGCRAAPPRSRRASPPGSPAAPGRASPRV